jgi:hypothetical protein
MACAAGAGVVGSTAMIGIAVAVGGGGAPVAMMAAAAGSLAGA